MIPGLTLRDLIINDLENPVLYPSNVQNARIRELLRGSTLNKVVKYISDIFAQIIKLGKSILEGLFSAKADAEVSSQVRVGPSRSKKSLPLPLHKPCSFEQAFPALVEGINSPPQGGRRSITTSVAENGNED